MIHAEKARELTEEASVTIYEDTLKWIEKKIKEAADNAYDYCEVYVHELLIDDIELLLENYDYTVYTICSLKTELGKECLRISW